MGVLARCALVVIACAGVTTAGLRRIAPADTSALRAVIQSERTDGTPFSFEWASLATGANLVTPDGLFTDDEIIALLLGTWGHEPLTPPSETAAADSHKDTAGDLNYSESAPSNRGDEDMSDIVLDGVLGDRTVDDDSPFITLGELGFDELELVTHDENEDIIRRFSRAEGAANTSAGKWGGHRSANVPHAAGRFDPAAARASGLGMIDSGYYLDWPWSTRPGRNMFYWLVGPPALVFFVVGAMGVASEMGSRSS